MIRLLPLLVVLAILVGIVSFRGQIFTAIKKYQLKNAPVLTELTSQAYLDRILAGDGRIHPEETKAVWFNQEIDVPITELVAQIMDDPQTVLGQTAANPNKWIEINLSTQRLYARDNDRIVYDMPVSTGLPWMPTVTGDFRIWSKVRAQRMSGGSVANGTFYDLPNVPFVQYFHGAYGLHGTYWHNDFGKPRSHGCVNLSIADAEKLYYWTDPILSANEHSRYRIQPVEATRIVVYGTTPTTL